MFTAWEKNFLAFFWVQFSVNSDCKKKWYCGILQLFLNYAQTKIAQFTSKKMILF